MEKWGFINKLGEFVIKPLYDYPGIFYRNYGAVAVKEGNGFKWGIIDKNGNKIIDCKYEMILPFD